METRTGWFGSQVMRKNQIEPDGSGIERAKSCIGRCDRKGRKNIELISIKIITYLGIIFSGVEAVAT